MKTLLLHPTDFKRMGRYTKFFEAEGIKLAEDKFGVCKQGFGYTITQPKLGPMPSQYLYLPLKCPEPSKFCLGLSTI